MEQEGRCNSPDISIGSSYFFLPPPTTLSTLQHHLVVRVLERAGTDRSSDTVAS
jgi:hypothetical protein